MLKTVLFDLDDTLFDHQYSRRCGLRALGTLYSQLTYITIEELEKEHERLLLQSYYQVLDGRVTLEDARIKRIRLLGNLYGINLSMEEAVTASRVYNEIYEANRRAVPGVSNLLLSIKNEGIRTGVVTNGFMEAQHEKLRICNLHHLFDFVLISEEIGIRKPDAGIFERALQLAGAGSEEVLLIGDSWLTDIIGAFNCGIKVIWFNRYGYSCPDFTIPVSVISSFEPLENVMEMIKQLINGAY